MENISNNPELISISGEIKEETLKQVEKTKDNRNLSLKDFMNRDLSQ